MQAEFRYWDRLAEDEPDYISEQSLYRLEQVKLKSPECLSEKGCKMCGCTFPEKSFESQPCDGGCYPELMNKEQWEIFKEVNNITNNE